jgi:hypothetical protein
MNKNRETLMKFISAQNQKVQDDISKQGYKDNSPYRDNPFNIIQGTPQGTSITMDGVSKRLYATDGQTSKILEPNSGTHFFSGPTVKEIALAKYGGLLNKTITCSNCGWSWKAADGGSDVMDCHKCSGKGLIKAQEGLEYFNQVKDWYNKYTNSPGYKENLIKSGYEDPQAIIDRRLANINNTKFKHRENRLGSYYNNKSNKILYSPIKDQMNFPGDGPDAILAHEVGHSSIDIGDGFFQGFKPNYNEYDYKQLKKRNKNPKISRGAHENYADQKALQYEAEKQGLYKAGYDEFTKEILDKLDYSDLKERALRNYSEEDLIWLLNNVAQSDNNKYELPVAEWGGAGMMYADRNYQEGGLTKYQIKGEVTEMKDWFLQNLPSPLLKQFPDLTKKDNSDVYDNYTSSLQSKLSSLIGTTFVPNLKGTQDEGQESLNCIGGACNASIKSGVNIPLITGNDFWDQAERKKIPFMVYANPKNKGDYAEALSYAKPGDFIGYSIYDGKTDYLPTHTNIFVNRFEKDGEEYIRTLDAYGEEGYHYKDYKVSELIEGGPYGKLFLGRPTRINGKNLNVNDLGLTKYFNDFSYAKEVPENVLNNLKPLSFTLNKDFVKKNNLTPEQVQQAATIINIASNKKRDIIKNTGMSEKTYDILARGLPGIVYNETRLGDTGIGRNIYEFAKTAATKLSKEGASEGPFQIRHKMMFKNPQTRKVLETLGITSDNYDSSNLGQQTVMAMVLFDNIEKTSLKDFDKPLKEKYYTISPEDAKKHGYDFKNMTDEQKEKIRQEHVKTKKNKESLSLFEKLIYLYNAPSIVKKREAQGDLQYAKVANNFLNMYLPKKQVGGPSYTVTGDQPIIIPSQGSYPLEYRDRGDKDVDGVPFSAARMVSRVDAQGKPLTRNQIAENQLMWNMQKQAYSPQQQLFNNWKNNPENTEQGFYNMSDWEKYLKSITPKGKDVPLEGLEIGKANKRGEVKGSCTTGDSMGGDSLRDNKYGGLTKYQNAGAITSEERKPYNSYPPVNGVWLGNKLTKEGYITSTTKGGNRISFTGDVRADDWINKQIDSGKFGFDPKTGGTFLLKKPVKGLSKEDQFIGSRTFYDLQAPQGFTSESQDAQIKKLPEWQQDIIDAENTRRRKRVVRDQWDEVYKSPLWYAPGAIATGGLGLLGLEAAGAAAAPYITTALATQLPGMAAVPGATFGNAITAGFAGHGLANVGPDAVEMYKNPSWGNAGSLGMDVLEIAPIVGPAAKTIGEGISATRKALGTEEGLLSNTYKINPYAERLNDANKSYRVTGLDALEDFKNTGVVRSGDGSLHTFKFADLKGNFHQIKRPTGFPSFQKGYADMRYAPEEGAVVFETALPTFKRGEINPVTGNRIRGRHYAHRVINPETGLTMTEIPAADVRVFGDKPHWWKGYQELEVPTLTTEESALAKLDNIRNTGAALETESLNPMTRSIVEKYLKGAEAIQKGIKKVQGLSDDAIRFYRSNNFNISKKAIEDINAGNKWSRDWYSNPITQKRYDEWITPANRFVDSKTALLYSNLDNTIPGLETINLNKSFGDRLAGTIARNNLEKLITEGKGVEATTSKFLDNSVGRYSHINNDALVDINHPSFFKKLFGHNYNVKNTTLHEDTHFVTKGDKGFKPERLKEIKEPFYKPKDINEKEITNYKYLTKPTEIHARINELRATFNLTPETIVTDEMVNKIINLGLKGKTSVVPDFFKLIKDKNGFKNLMNSLPAIVPIGLTVGAGAAVLPTEKQGGVTKTKQNKALSWLSS